MGFTLTAIVGDNLKLLPTLGYTNGNPSALDGWIRPNAVYIYDVPDNPPVYQIEIHPGSLFHLESNNNLSTYNVWIGTHPEFGGAIWYFGSLGGVFALYPDDYASVVDGRLMPLSGSIYVVSPNPFLAIFPDANIEYDCTDTYLQAFLGGRLVPTTDIAANYSWSSPSGAGWSYFPLTGDDRVPNSPNVHVEMEIYSWPSYYGPFSGDNLRMNGVTSQVDLTGDNDHTAVFEYPIPECGDLNLGIEYRATLQGGVDGWFPLDTQHQTRASNVDHNGSGGVDLGDMSAFTFAMGSCEGDQAYSPCFDIIKGEPDCIDLADGGAIVELLYMEPNKDEYAQGMHLVVEGELCSSVADCPPLALLASEPWDVAVVAFEIASGDVMWEPVGAFVERSVLIERPGVAGQYRLVLFGPAPAGTVEIGRVAASGDKAKLAGTGFTAIGASSDGAREPEQEPVETASAVGIVVAPNPFNPSTTIFLDLVQQESGRLAVYALDGGLVKVLGAGAFASGRHEYRWDGTDSMGRTVSAGTYIYLYSSATGRNLTGKMTLLK
ncbi:MAG: hypothetical protein IH621_18920 [Krumholzibacteria bacterium]|nr:hypothetical protein [Candidatus Krumholzibacteria bacterium]